MGQRGTETIRIDRDGTVASIVSGLDCYCAVDELGGDRADNRIGSDQARRPRRSVSLELIQEAIHPGYRILHGLQHITLKIRVFDVALRVGYDQAKLTCQVLDVVDDEGEALAVFGQQLAVAQHSRRSLFGEITGRLTPCRAQQVESFPVEGDASTCAI